MRPGALGFLIAGGLFSLQADASPSLPPPLPGEALRHAAAPFDARIAPPAAGPEGSIELFEAGTRWRLWPLDERRRESVPLPGFQLPHGPRIGYANTYPARYASVASAQGTWLIGPTIELVRADGSRQSARPKAPRHRVRALALPDGALLAVGGYSWPERRDFTHNLRIERIWLDAGGRIQSEELPPIPVELKGSGVWEGFDGYHIVLTADGHLMVAGDPYRNLCLLLDLQRRTWQKLPAMAAGRDRPALLRLPDGRIWASGGGGRGRTETTSELWDPRRREWSPGPDLPLPMVDHSAVFDAAQGVALLAGGQHAGVVGWRPGSAPAFIAATHAAQRRHAGVFVLPGGRLALAGGDHARHYGEAWGRPTPGIAVVPYLSQPAGQRPPAWPATHDGALLERDGLLLAVGGYLHHTHHGSDEDAATRLAESLDPDGRTARSLPPLPVSVGPTQAAWIGPRAVLIQAETAEPEGLARQWLGVLDPLDAPARTLPLPPGPTHAGSDGQHRRMRLVGAHDGQGWLIAEDAGAVRVAAQPPHYTPAERLQRQRRGFAGRVLADGRVVVAGGEVESELVAARPADCADCPPRYLGFGPLLPSRRHEWYDPHSGVWTSSAPARASGGPVAILADGRVAKLGEFRARADDPAAPPGALLELSDAEGRRWRTLPLPPGFPADSPAAARALHAPQNAVPAAPRALFVGYQNGDTVPWWWLPDVDAPEPAWLPLGEASPPHAFPPGEHDSGIRTAAGRLLWVGGSAGVIGVTRR